MSAPLRASKDRWTPWFLLGIAVVLAAALTWISQPDALARVENAAPYVGEVVRAGNDATELAAAASAQAASPEFESPPQPKSTTRTTPGSTRARTERWSEGVVTGRVLGGPGASEPIAGLLVRASSPRSTFPIPPLTTRTDRDGRFEFRGLVAASWEIDAWLTEQDRRGAATVELNEEETPTAEVDVLLSYDRHILVRLVDVRGRSIDADTLGIDPQYLPLVGVGVGTACVESGEPLRPQGMVKGRVVDKSPKDERHTFDVVVQGVGAECVLALFNGYALTSRRLAREDGELELVVDARDIARVLGACTVEVVRAGDGLPIESGRVTFRPPAVRIVRDIGSGGIASVTGVPIGAIDVEVEASGYGRRVMRVRVPTDQPVRVELKPARTLTGTIAIVGEGSAAALKPAVWRIRDPSARLHNSTAIGGRRTDTDAFVFEDLEPAVYVVAAAPQAVSALTGAEVRAGNAIGATWVDLTDVETADVRLEVPDWLANP